MPLPLADNDSPVDVTLTIVIFVIALILVIAGDRVYANAKKRASNRTKSIGKGVVGKVKKPWKRG